MMKYNPATGEVRSAVELSRDGSKIPVSEVIAPPISEKPGEVVETSTSECDPMYHIFHF